MKIKAVKTFIVTESVSADNWTDVKSFLFVKIETDEGIHGWGEAYALSDQERSIAKLIQELGRYLIDTNPLNPRRFAANALRSFAEKRSGLSFYCAVSALEMALWDISGKARDLPVYALLGGAFHERIRLYANFWSTRDQTTEAIVEKALEMKERGFTAIKIYPFRCPTLALAEDRVCRVRDAIGPEMDLMIDLSGPDDPIRSQHAALRFAEYDPYWIEEPVDSADLDNLAHITATVPQRIVTGERLAGKPAFREVLVRRAANMINPDIAACGGIQTFLDIAAMADSFGVPVTPHNYNSMSVAHAAMLQVAALAPNCPISEYFPCFELMSHDISLNPLEVDAGYAALPSTPGLGLDLDESALNAHAYTESKPRNFSF